MVETKQIECPECDGTGIIKAGYEKDGAGRECTHCNGTGYTTINYTLFTERKLRTDVKRVYRSNGYVVSAEDHDGIHFSQYGCSYDEWISGVTPKPVEEIECPFQATHQSWRECPMIKNGIRIGYIPHCENRKNMKECWNEYHLTNTST